MYDNRKLNIPCDSVTGQIMKFIREWESRFPEDEMIFLTLPKYDCKERERVISRAMEFLRNEKFDKHEESLLNESAENTL